MLQMNMKLCYIMGAAPTQCKIEKKEDDLLIAADAGYAQLFGQEADFVVGDFDSLSYVPEHPHVIQHSPQKDDTDMLLSIKLGLEQGYRHFILLGALGGRLDHTLANLQSLAYLRKHGACGILIGDNENVLLLENERLRLEGRAGAPLSVFAYEHEATGVTLENLAYPLKDAVLYDTFPLGVSNAFTDQAALICTPKDRLLVVWQGHAAPAEIFANIRPLS